MKTYCEKCHEDLTPYIDKKIIGFYPGKITCPKCQKQQSRYISQTDLLLFLILSEIVYLCVLLFTLFLYDKTNFSYWSLIILFPFLILVIFLMKYFARYIYSDAPFKKIFKDHAFKEDVKHINKGFNYRIIVFGALSMTILANEDIKYYAAITLAITIGLTFIRFLLCLREEKKIAK